MGEMPVSFFEVLNKWVSLKHLAFQESCFCKKLLQRGSAPSEWYGERVSCECFSTRGNVDIYKSFERCRCKWVTSANLTFSVCVISFIPRLRSVCEYLWEMAVVTEFNSSSVFFFFARNRKQEYCVKSVFQLDFPDFQCVGVFSSCAALRICL